jgi:hypothetical protein
MGKKLLALALLGAVAYLFRTKKGNELRKQAMGSGKKAMDQLRVKFQHANGHLTEALDSF